MYVDILFFRSENRRSDYLLSNIYIIIKGYYKELCNYCKKRLMEKLKLR